MAGVNGTGKTTTSGKLAHHLSRELGHSVVLVAADTFRAAAVEQLELWAQRAGAEFVRGPEGTDPGSVAFEGVATAIESGADVVIVDTAGRLHTQDDLMGELSKIRRVIAKQIPTRRMRRCSRSMRPPVRTACVRRSCSRRRSMSQGWC